MNTAMPGSGDIKSVVVLGKPRSGTSLTAGILSILGVSLSGKTIPSAFNPKGSFEDWDFDEMNREILREAGGNDLLSLPPLARILEQEENFREPLRALITRKMKPPIWGWKTPSTALLMELYLPLIVNPHFVVVLRNPLSNAQSLVEFTRHMAPDVTVLDMLRVVSTFDRAVLDFLDCHKELPALFVAFEDIVADPQKESRRIAAFLGLRVNEDMEERILELRIPRARIEGQRRIGFLKGLPSRAVGVLRRCYRDPGQSLDQIAQAFRLTLNIFRSRRG